MNYSEIQCNEIQSNESNEALFIISYSSVTKKKVMADSLFFISQILQEEVRVKFSILLFVLIDNKLLLYKQIPILKLLLCSYTI